MCCNIPERSNVAPVFKYWQEGFWGDHDLMHNLYTLTEIFPPNFILPVINNLAEWIEQGPR